MRRRTIAFALVAPLLAAAAQAQDAPEFPRFEAQQIDPHIGNVCYAVTVADINGDGKPDVVAVSEDAVYWYENPAWTKHEVIRGQTERDNVCIAAHDIDGDGKIDLALGAGWRPPDTTKPGTLQWLGRDAEGRWQLHPIRFEEPSIHRIRWGDVLGTGKAQLIVVPLQGRGTKGPDWGDGAGVKVRVFSVPDDPTQADWPSEVACDDLHTIHNFQPINADDDPRDEILVAAWEGVFLLDRGDDGTWSRAKLGDGEQGAGSSNKGASEIKLGRRGDGSPYIATVEPWHGDKVVVYTPSGDADGPLAARSWTRHVLDEGVTWGHAVWCADLDEKGGDELIIGQRDPRKDSTPPKGPGVLVFDLESWVEADRLRVVHKQAVDDGGMACEDALAADLDGDGRPEIIAGGRATHNVKIYWNRGVRR
jgi:hypothetical protein